MQEFELKYQVPHAEAAALEQALAAGPGAGEVRLRAVYFDTPGRWLARAHMALRLRREGEQWVQTLKAVAEDGLTRLEHNQPRAGAAAPGLDLTLHEGTPAGERLSALLREAGEPLAATYGTDIRRRTLTLESAEGRVELAFDRGEIRAGERVLPVCELELELLHGRHAAVLREAGRRVERHGLWLDVRSKAERGDRLARGAAGAPATEVPLLAAPAGADGRAAWRAALLALWPGLLRNASELCDETQQQDSAQAAAQLQALRLGLKAMLRAACSVARLPGAPDTATLAREVRALRRQLSAAPEPAAAGAWLRSGPAQALWLRGLDGLYAA
ncbi:CYTH domain-containing protein [Aquabacterium sp. A7-Y]|uniref:CYTH domain-containing protein n=1 Tax=Aquabacterium sp. A7-Y TaxID=1349605 RepID=UPI00223CF04F|nr:CYTH domain-containing protein [Aquabacterium sp. A7-Y]MCW7538755.1 CYTH domain-containing protein [Aquabacterium sp. A7-Y]